LLKDLGSRCAGKSASEEKKPKAEKPLMKKKSGPGWTWSTRQRRLLAVGGR